MAGGTKPRLAELIRKRVFRNILIPASFAYAILAVLLVSSHLWILKKQLTHKAHMASVTVEEFISNAKKVIRLYHTKLLEHPEQIDFEEGFMLTRYFHNISIVDMKKLTVKSSTVGELIGKINVAIPWEEVSVPSSYTERFVPPYYSSFAKGIVLGLVGRYDTDYAVVGEINLSRLWNFARAVVTDSDYFFVTDNFGNYVTHADVERVCNQENISHLGWFPTGNPDRPLFTVGSLDGSWFLIAGEYNPAYALWSFVLTPVSTALEPTFRVLVFMIFFALSFILALRWFVMDWLNNMLVIPFGLFASHVRQSPEDKICCDKPEGFFPFREGEMLEKTCQETMAKLLEDERAIHESEEKFRIISETAPVGIFVFQDDRIVYVNREGTRIMGYSQEEFLEIVPFWQLVHEEYQDVVAHNATRRQQGLLSKQVTYEFPVKSKSGDIRHVRAMVSSTTLKGKPAGIITIVDLTEIKKAEEERKKLEAQLQRSQRLESLGTLVAGISHEFNNILHAIALNIEHLGMKLQGASIQDDTIQKHIKDVTVLHERAANIIKELLAFSRAEGAVKREFSLREEIERVVRLCKQVFPRSIEMRTKFEVHDVFVMAGEGQLEQIFLNLLNNARDAIEDRGEEGFIEIRTELLSNRVNSQYVKITVKDSGIGIPTEALDRIFEPFFTTKALGKGTGLGLSMVYGIVKQLGGTITCESTWGEGTTFTLVLPVLASSEHKVNTSSPYQPKQDISASDVSRQAKILVVEDEPMIQNLMTEFLKREGYMVDTASSAEEALAFLDVSSYNLIITDLGLPGMGGEKFLDELAKRNLGIPIIVASGYLRGKKVLESPERYGIVVTLSKPFSVGKLKEAVEKALSKRNQT